MNPFHKGGYHNWISHLSGILMNSIYGGPSHTTPQQPNKTKSYQPNPQTTHPTKVGKNHNTPFYKHQPKTPFFNLT